MCSCWNVFLMALLLQALFLPALCRSDESVSPLSFSEQGYFSGMLGSYPSSEHMLAMMRTDFGDYLEQLPSLYPNYDAPMSQAARMALYWSKRADLRLYSTTVVKSQASPVSVYSSASMDTLYSHYAVKITPDSCSRMDLLAWIEAGGTAAGLVNVLTPLPLGIQNKDEKTSREPPYAISHKLLRHYEKKLSVFASCYSVFIANTNFTSVPDSFFSLSEFDAPFFSGIRFSALIQLSKSSPEFIAKFFSTTNSFIQAWLPRDFWRFLQDTDSSQSSDFATINAWVQARYFDLENSFFAKGYRSDTLAHARRTCFLLHRAMTSFVWEVDRLPRYPSLYSTKFIKLLEDIVVKQIFLKFGILPSVEEIETSPELAFKVLGLIKGAGRHFHACLIKGPVYANLKKKHMPPLEPVLGRIPINQLVEIPGWPYLLEHLGVSVESFSWKSLPDNWFSSLSQNQLFPLYDGGSWSAVRYLKTVINPDWKDIQRCHLFTFITPRVMSQLSPVQQLLLLVHPDSQKYLSLRVFTSLSEDRVRLLHEHAAAQGLSSLFKHIIQKYYGPAILQLEDEPASPQQLPEGIGVSDKPLQEENSNLE